MAWPLLLALALLFIALLAGGRRRRRRLPPGPPALPVLGNIHWARLSLSEIESALRPLHQKYGPVVALRIGARVFAFVADRRVAHQALVVQHGAALADRPEPAVRRLLVGANADISTSPYGPRWRLLRRNLVSETLHPVRVRQFAAARSWALGKLVDRLRSESRDEGANGVDVVEALHFAMFSLLVGMCFGAKLKEEAVRDIAAVQRALLLHDSKLGVFAVAPALTTWLFRKRLDYAKALLARQKSICVLLIQARRDYKKRGDTDMSESQFEHSYVDSLLELTLPEEGGRSLADDEIVTLCHEFLTAGTDTTTTGLQWILAELVKHPDIQAKLYKEMAARNKSNKKVIEEEDLQDLPYLKAVVLEGLRRHPPAHFVLPHAAAEDVEVGGYLIPKGSIVNFEVARIGRDDTVWEKPENVEIMWCIDYN